MDTNDDVDRLCDDLKARAQALATEAKRLRGQSVTPERRNMLERLNRDMHLLQLAIRRLLQAGRVH